MKQYFRSGPGTIPVTLKNTKRILFASVPADGHFNPLTGLAMHLKQAGYDVRWYSSSLYTDKLKKLSIPHYTFTKALDINGKNLEEIFPERQKHKSQLSRLNFDLINVFILRSTEYFEDIQNIRAEFPFDIMICDAAFSAIPLVKEKLQIPVISIGIFPLPETSKDLAPVGMGMTPRTSLAGRLKQNMLRFIADKILFARPNKLMRKICNDHGIQTNESNVFDLMVKKSSLLLQSGTPGFEYKRSDLGKNVRFIGALLPYTSSKITEPWFDERINRYEKIILVTQGTVERDVEKIIVPTLEAFKDSDFLVIATTGGSGTKELKDRYPYDNLIIEDFIPFGEIMPYTDVYITNGGYGGVMLGIQNQLPMVVAGVHEGKNEITARVGYFELGINLKTEAPIPSQLRGAVAKIMSDDKYKKNITRLAREFEQYDPNELCEQYVEEQLKQGSIFKAMVINNEPINVN